MEEQKPTSVKTVGLLVAIFSGLIIFGNGMGALAFSVIGMGEGTTNQSTNSVVSSSDPISFLFDHYLMMCLIMITIGLFYLVGGLFVRKYKLWANRLVSIISILQIIIIWCLMITMFIAAHKQGGIMSGFSYGAIGTALFWSTPIGLLIWFLNKSKIKKHFA